MVVPGMWKIVRFSLSGLFRNCPVCRRGKVVCVVACAEVSKRLDRIDMELRRVAMDRKTVSLGVVYSERDADVFIGATKHLHKEQLLTRPTVWQGRDMVEIYKLVAS